MHNTSNPNAVITDAQTKIEMVGTLANAVQLTKLVFLEVSGREVSNLDHSATDIDDLIGASINKHIASA